MAQGEGASALLKGQPKACLSDADQQLIYNKELVESGGEVGVVVAQEGGVSGSSLGLRLAVQTLPVGRPGARQRRGRESASAPRWENLQVKFPSESAGCFRYLLLLRSVYLNEANAEIEPPIPAPGPLAEPLV